MFGFGGLEHTWEMFFREYTSFLLILVGFLEIGTESANLGNFEVLRHGIGILRSSLSPHRGAAMREAWTSLGYAKVYQSYVAV